jgi:hypothetical protein
LLSLHFVVELKSSCKFTCGHGRQYILLLAVLSAVEINSRIRCDKVLFYHVLHYLTKKLSIAAFLSQFRSSDIILVRWPFNEVFMFI